MAMTQGAKYMASAGMTPAQIAHFQQMPVWMTAVWAIGVWGAFLASILLLLRRKLAFAVFAPAVCVSIKNNRPPPAAPEKLSQASLT